MQNSSALPTVAKPAENKENKDSKVHVFVSNYDLKDEVAGVFSTANSAVQAYDRDLFQNRSLQDLVDRGITNLWLNISDKKCKHWFRHNIEQDKNPYIVVIPVYNYVKDTWVTNLESKAEEYFDEYFHISFSKFLGSKALTFVDLIKGLKAQGIEISAPTCCGPIGAFAKKLITKSGSEE